MNQPSTPSINPWNYKPWWCQPWAILLTGMTLILGSYLIFQRIWLVLLVATPVSVWMGFFLMIWPRAMKQILESDSRE
ncbi:MAG: DUF6737 family protein [Microcoleaceae cyanobacterium]